MQEHKSKSVNIFEQGGFSPPILSPFELFFNLITPWRSSVTQHEFQVEHHELDKEQGACVYKAFAWSGKWKMGMFTFHYCMECESCCTAWIHKSSRTEHHICPHNLWKSARQQESNQWSSSGARQNQYVQQQGWYQQQPLSHTHYYPSGLTCLLGVQTCSPGDTAVPALNTRLPSGAFAAWWPCESWFGISAAGARVCTFFRWVLFNAPLVLILSLPFKAEVVLLRSLLFFSAVSW